MPEKRLKEKRAAAIKYLKEKLEVPVISAYGRGEFAYKIIEEAIKKGIEVVKDENFFKFEHLFSVNSYIPLEVYKIVAEIIASVINTNVTKR